MSIALADALEDVELEEGRTYRCEVHGRQVEVRVLANPMSSANLRNAGMMLDSNDVHARLEDIRNLKDGWLDGKGVAPSRLGLDWFTKTFDANYPPELPQPFIYPTAEGGLQIEWSLGEHELSLEIDLANHIGAWHRLHLGTQQDDTRNINFEVDAEWRRLADEIANWSGTRSRGSGLRIATCKWQRAIST